MSLEPGGDPLTDLPLARTVFWVSKADVQELRLTARSDPLRKVPTADGLHSFAKRIARETELRESLTQVVSAHDPIHARTAFDAAKRGVARDHVAPLQKLPDRRRRVERFR